MRIKVQILIIGIIIFALQSCGISKSISNVPIEIGTVNDIDKVVKHNDTLFSIQNNYFIKNKQQLWELKVSGNSIERGLITGSLTATQIQKQEALFFDKVAQIVPSKSKQWLLRNFLKWYNRKLYLNISEEFKSEIHGISQFTSNKYDYIAPKYLRSLYLHGAHDIGHAMQDLALVGCSSVAVWGQKTTDGELLIGRNFDFYAGDEFAKDKVISFVTPNEGIPYMSVAWAGMVGVMSGMNKEGLTVTINAGKSKIPLVAKTPISILTREILQYASTIEQAIAIAKKRKVFVSESIMVASAKDKKVVLIEVSPKNFGVYDVQNDNALICTNHFQSKNYTTDKRNVRQIKESHSQYRYDKIQELIADKDKLNPLKMSQILRNTQGLKNENIGFGNEKSLNQLLAHHAIIFKPESKLVWVSSNPYQLGDFACYDLNKIFNKKENDFVVLSSDSIRIPKDEFLYTDDFKNYEKYRVQERIIEKAIANKEPLSNEVLVEYKKLNPQFWKVYYTVGSYYLKEERLDDAKKEFEIALTKEITTIPDREYIEKLLLKINKKLK